MLFETDHRHGAKIIRLATAKPIQIADLRSPGADDTEGGALRVCFTAGTDYGVRRKNIWRVADLGAKHAFLKSGLG
jgi:hypothetical protein